MKESEDKNFRKSWFFRWFLNNQAVVVLLVTLLVFLTIFVFTKISFLLTPVLDFLETILLPVVISALLYYLLLPFVTYLEKKGLSRIVAITVVFVSIILLLILAISAVLLM